MPVADAHPVTPAGADSGPSKPSPQSIRYLAVLIGVMIVALLFGLRRYSIFACAAEGYGSARYLAYCQADNYADYDHGAFWFNLEPEAVRAATDARVLFIGNSRMQFGLSTEAVHRWFDEAGASYYLLGFGYNGNALFEGPLLEKLRPRASAYIVNLDLFFEAQETPPSRAIKVDGAQARYRQKRTWQALHQPVCSIAPFACGNEVSFFRARPTGAWVVTGTGFQSAPVTYDDRVDDTVAQAYTEAGRRFLPRLAAREDCVILTTVPTANTGLATAKAVAEALNRPFIAPRVDDLQTFDASHLDGPSAERWSAAFMAAASNSIQQCVARPLAGGL